MSENEGTHIHIHAHKDLCGKVKKDEGLGIVLRRKSIDRMFPR